MKAFVGHSLDERGTAFARKIIEFIESTGIKCETGGKVQSKSIAEKVKNKIIRNEIFVGIFTRDKEILLKEGFWNKIFNKDRAYTTSNWVIQESGFAIGNDRKLILLVEDGVYKFPELQGDLEFIPFDSESTDEIFLKLNQIIEDIKSGGKEGVSEKTEEKVEDLEQREDEEQTERDKEEIKSKRDIAFSKLSKALFEDKDYKKAQEIFDKELKQVLEDYERPRWKAIVLRLSNKIGDVGAFDRLIKHVKEFGDNPAVARELAIRYKEMREYKKAKEQYLKIAAMYDSSKEDDRENIVSCYGQAASCLAYDGQTGEADKLLSSLLKKEGFRNFKANILSRLAKIAKIKGDTELFFIYAEGSLNIDPSDTDLKFDLAYRYSKQGHNKLSLLHYKKLTETSLSVSGLNNLGVEYETLELRAKSIESYLKASEHKSTISMANIAKRYLKQGFTRNASEEIKRANELSKEGIDIHGQVGVAKNMLDDKLSSEDEKEKQFLIDAEKEREFRVEYSEAFYCDKNVLKEKIDGRWITPWGEGSLIFDVGASSFKITGQKREEIGRTLLGMGGLFQSETSPREKNYKTIMFEIESKITNMSGKYSVKVEELTEYKHIPNEKTKTYEAKGLMVISEDFNTIHIMDKEKEKDKEKKLNIRSLRKKV